MAPKIPLILKLKKESQKNIARAQDIITEEAFKIFDKAVFHGGTAIWRCYNGNRFSEDIDVYIPKNLGKIDLFFETLEKRGFIIEKKKIGENSLYSNLRFNNINVRFEALFKIVNGKLTEYEAVDGEIIVVPCLKIEDIIREKVQAYSKRLKIRDLYDIFFLLRYVEDRDKIRKELNNLIADFKKPLDEKDLKILLFEGLTPTVQQMIDYIGRL